MSERFITTNFAFDGKELESALKNLRNVMPRCATGGFIPTYRYPQIEKVIYNLKNPNKPTTIVIWSDFTKTIVKCCDGEDFTKDGGLAQCYLKKILGSRGSIQKLINDADIQD